MATHFAIQFSSVAQLCLTLCDPMDPSTPGLPVHHQLPEFTQTQTMVLEKTLESPSDCKEIKPVNPKGNQS